MLTRLLSAPPTEKVMPSPASTSLATALYTTVVFAAFSATLPLAPVLIVGASFTSETAMVNVAASDEPSRLVAVTITSWDWSVS